MRGDPDRQRGHRAGSQARGLYASPPQGASQSAAYHDLPLALTSFVALEAASMLGFEERPGRGLPQRVRSPLPSLSWQRAFHGPPGRVACKEIQELLYYGTLRGTGGKQRVPVAQRQLFV